MNSRPSLLYQRLFITSLQVAGIIQDGLIVIAAFFAVLELIAFIMAVRLNQTITNSVSDLYVATQQIDKGNLSHRIAVKRQDQTGRLVDLIQRDDCLARGATRGAAREGASAERARNCVRGPE